METKYCPFTSTSQEAVECIEEKCALWWAPSSLSGILFFRARTPHWYEAECVFHAIQRALVLIESK
jgi:hypothetical protein